MITQLKIENFKSLQSVDLKLGRFNLFIGANASGKSNFFEALRVLQGIGYGYSIDEILNGKPKSGKDDKWPAIRGGCENACFIKHGKSTRKKIEPLISCSAKITVGKSDNFDFSIGFSPTRLSVCHESLQHNSNQVYASASGRKNAQSGLLDVSFNGGDEPSKKLNIQCGRMRPALDQLLGRDECAQDHEIIAVVSSLLGNMQRINPSPAILREYSQSQRVQRMGEEGEDFAALIRTITADKKTRYAYESWLRHLTPDIVEGVDTLSGAIGEALFAIKEQGRLYPAPVLSDGTLRFAAIAAAFFQPDMPQLLMIEEIETGIHPSRLRLLMELLKSQSSEDCQVIATTHSPVALMWLDEKDYDTVFFCKREDETGASIIRPLSQIPRLLETVRKYPLSNLFAEDWLEGAPCW